MNTVWVVMIGEDYEGGSILDIFANRPNDEDIMSLVHHYKDNPWRKTSDTTWRVGCEWIDVREHKVR